MNFRFFRYFFGVRLSFTWRFTSAWADVSKRELFPDFCFLMGVLSVYSNSVLATLNARNGIRELGEDSDEMSFSLQNFSKSGEGQVGSAVSFLPIVPLAIS